AHIILADAAADEFAGLRVALLPPEIGEAQAVAPKLEAFFQILARDDRNAAYDTHCSLSLSSRTPGNADRVTIGVLAVAHVEMPGRDDLAHFPSGFHEQRPRGGNILGIEAEARRPLAGLACARMQRNVASARLEIDPALLRPHDFETKDVAVK